MKQNIIAYVYGFYDNDGNLLNDRVENAISHDHLKEIEYKYNEKLSHGDNQNACMRLLENDDAAKDLYSNTKAMPVLYYRPSERRWYITVSSDQENYTEQKIDVIKFPNENLNNDPTINHGSKKDDVTDYLHESFKNINPSDKKIKQITISYNYNNKKYFFIISMINDVAEDKFLPILTPIHNAQARLYDRIFKQKESSFIRE